MSFDLVVVGEFLDPKETNIVSEVMEIARQKGENIMKGESLNVLKNALSSLNSASTIAVIAHSDINGELIMDGYTMSKNFFDGYIFRIFFYSCFSKIANVAPANSGQINYITDFVNYVDPDNSSPERDEYLDQVLCLGYSLGSKQFKEILRDIKNNWRTRGAKEFNNLQNKITPSGDCSGMTEYVVPSIFNNTGENQHRIVAVRDGDRVTEMYFTADHYLSFTKVYP